MSVEYVRAAPEAVAPFFRASDREALKTCYDFPVIWHEQSHDFAALDGDRTIAAATIRIAASLAHIERIIVDPANRRNGIGRELLERAAGVANYYNCHKMTVMVPHQSGAQQFFEACGYKVEGILPQHTFKLDMAILRKFLL